MSIDELIGMVIIEYGYSYSLEGIILKGQVAHVHTHEHKHIHIVGFFDTVDSFWWFWSNLENWREYCKQI